MMSILPNFLLCVFGLWTGLKFADIDLAPPLPFRHRSAWTHGPLVTWLVVYLLTIFPMGYWFAVGFLPMNAIHLLADMFPRNWKGGATIKLHPVQKELAPIFSFIWLGFGAYQSGLFFLQITGQLWGWWPL